MASLEVGFKSNEHLGSRLPLKTILFVKIILVLIAIKNTKFTPHHCVSKIIPFASIRFFLEILFEENCTECDHDQFIVMSEWVDKGKKTQVLNLF